MKYRLLIGILFLSSVSYADLYSKILIPSVVIHAVVEEKDEKGNKSRTEIECSGTYIDKDEVLTAAHCLVDVIPGKLWIRTIEGNSYPSQVILFDRTYDLGLIKVFGPNHKYTRLGSAPKIGQKITNVGSPDPFEFLVSDGIVEAVHRHFKPFWSSFFLTSAMINPGSSGGGVFNNKGALIGVNTMSPGFFGWIGISIAVDLDSIQTFLEAR